MGEHISIKGEMDKLTNQEAEQAEKDRQIARIAQDMRAITGAESREIFADFNAIMKQKARERRLAEESKDNETGPTN